MKKYLVMVVAAMMATMNVKAQNEDLKHEIGVSYGVGISTIADGIGNAIGSGLWDGLTGYEWTNDTRVGTVAVEYFHHMKNPRLAVGGVVTYAQFGEDVMKKDTKQITGERTRHYFSVMPSVKYYWVNKNHFGLYSKAAAGVMMLVDKRNDKEINKNETDNDIFFMGQVSPVGVEFGSKVRGFVEAGFGEQGIVLAGVKYKF